MDEAAAGCRGRQDKGNTQTKSKGDPGPPTPSSSSSCTVSDQTKTLPISKKDSSYLFLALEVYKPTLKDFTALW